MPSVFGNVFRLNGGESVWANVFILTITPGVQERVTLEATSKRRTALEITSRERTGLQAVSKQRIGIEV